MKPLRDTLLIIIVIAISVIFITNIIQRTDLKEQILKNQTILNEIREATKSESSKL